MMFTHQWLASMSSSHPSLAKAIKNEIFSYIQFDAGGIDEIPFEQKNEFLHSRAPFQKTVIQFEIYDPNVSHILVFWHEIDEKTVDILLGFRVKKLDKWFTDNPVTLKKGNDEKFFLEGYAAEGALQDQLPTLKVAVSYIKNLFYILGCSNVITETHPAPQALNKKRAKAGKLPIFEYKTLHLNVPGVRVEGPPLGGTHASPRVHLRRGHVRNLGNGKRVWVQACVVGSNHGMIHKDYKIKTHNQGMQA